MVIFILVPSPFIYLCGYISSLHVGWLMMDFSHPFFISLFFLLTCPCHVQLLVVKIPLFSFLIYRVQRVEGWEQFLGFLYHPTLCSNLESNCYTKPKTFAWKSVDLFHSYLLITFIYNPTTTMHINSRLK